MTDRPSGKGATFARDTDVFRLSIRLTKDDMARLVRMAEARDRSPAAQARHIIRLAVLAHKEG